jgi:signal transduction histidine kinase
MSSSSKKASILVVDDTSENLHFLVHSLQNQGYRVRAAPNGHHALISVHKEQPDLILLDIMMPDLDGYEVCRRLKANDHSREIPVIFISALDEGLDKAIAFEVGGVDYVTKPFETEELFARVHTHLTLHQMRRTLQQKNATLQQQNAELDAFAHTVAHDLQTSLGIIMGYAELLFADSEANTAEDLARIGENSYKAAQKASTIVHNLLRLASIRKEEVVLQPLKMADIMEQVRGRLEPVISDSGATVTFPESWPVALGYGPWIEEVWVNYLSNGLKYGGQPPQLELGATPQPDGCIRFWVQDNGRGLSPEEQALLFTEFTRLDQTKIKGHGLGLSIVRRIMDKLGGQVGVVSEPGQGSCFFFTLKMSEPAA